MSVKTLSGCTETKLVGTQKVHIATVNCGKTDNDNVINAKSETNEKELVKDKQISTSVGFLGMKSKVMNDKYDKKSHEETVPFKEHARNADSHVYGNTGCIDVAEEKVLIYDMNNDVNCDKFMASIVPISMHPILT